MLVRFTMLSSFSDRTSQIKVANIKKRKNTWKYGTNSTYSISAAEKSGLLKAIPALYFVNEAEVVLNPTSAPIQRSLLPIAAESSNWGDGFKPILESMAAWGWRYCTSSWGNIA